MTSDVYIYGELSSMTYENNILDFFCSVLEYGIISKFLAQDNDFPAF